MDRQATVLGLLATLACVGRAQDDDGTSASDAVETTSEDTVAGDNGSDDARVVDACMRCERDAACVAGISETIAFACVAIPQACNGTPTCACMGEQVCAPSECRDLAYDDVDLACVCLAC